MRMAEGVPHCSELASISAINLWNSPWSRPKRSAMRFIKEKNTLDFRDLNKVYNDQLCQPDLFVMVAPCLFEFSLLPASIYNIKHHFRDRLFMRLKLLHPARDGCQAVVLTVSGIWASTCLHVTAAPLHSQGFEARRGFAHLLVNDHGSAYEEKKHKATNMTQRRSENKSKIKVAALT